MGGGPTDPNICLTLNFVASHSATIFFWKVWLFGHCAKSCISKHWWLIWLIWLRTILLYLINVKFAEACLDSTTPQYSLKCSFSHNERYLFKDLLSPLSKYTSVNIYNSEKHAFTYYLVIIKDTFSKTCFYLFQTVLLYIFVFYDS